jgi:peroxiredoxin Q/BCP
MKTVLHTVLATTLLAIIGFTSLPSAVAADLKVSDPAPTFTTADNTGKDFTLDSRKGKWTVLYFYPKAGTPGCTKQACGFRDGIKKIHDLGAEVFGISADTVADQAKFHEAQHLNFTLLADPDSKVIEQYGSKMTGMNMSKRWTFIIDPKLTIRDIERDVDPVLDATKVAAKIAELQKTK